MRYRFFLLFIVLACAGKISAQISAFTPGDMVVKEKWDKKVFTGDDKGSSIQNGYADISETPYFNEVYKFANIKLARGRAFNNVKTRIDLVAQAACIILPTGTELNIEPGLAKEITYADTTKEGIVFYKFQTGFPSIDKQNGNNFYLVLAEGRCGFVKSIFKKEVEQKKIVYGDITHEYETVEDYYLFAKGAMKKLKKDRDFILAELSDKQAQISEFIQSNNTNFKNIDQLIKLFNYYNSL